MLRIKKEEEEMKKRMEMRRAIIAKQRSATVAVASPWIRMRRPFRSQTVKVVVLSISVATMAWMYNYIRPGLEVF